MTGVGTADAVGRLAEGGAPALAAVFLTYTFDPAFFEEEVLAAVLPLQEDPVETPRRFLDEGRRRLVECPVLVVADAGMLRGGQRLPYDLVRAAPGRTFHPKLALVLRAADARLVVGSGNLTVGGHGGNAELSVALTLDYRRDAALLRAVVAFVEACGARGEAWTRLRAELDPRLSTAEGDPDAPPWLLHSEAGRPLLDAFLARLPADARIERIGVLAPFHQEDHAPPDGAVFDRLLAATEGRRARGFTLDVGLSWEGNPVGPGSGRHEGPLDARIGELWAETRGDAGQESTAWFVLGRHEERSFAVWDGRREEWRSSRDLNARCAAGRAWPVGPVEAFGPAELVGRAASRVEVRAWLHPEVHRQDGRVYRQPLHGKLLAVAVTEGGRRRTWLFVGSPNASAAALLRTDGNVECGVVLVVDGHLGLAELCPRLVPVPLAQLGLRERAFVALPPSPARWVEDVVHDAADATLRIAWRPGAPALAARYPLTPPRPLATGVPTGDTVVPGFVLDPACCEVEVQEASGGPAARVPIRVENAVHLPVAGLGGEPTLAELLLLHGGRYTPAGIAARRAAGAGGGEGSEGLRAVFGKALAPRDVFRALLAVGDELRAAGSLGAFEALMAGPWGVRRLGERLADAAARGDLLPVEAWIYGMELARVLAAVDLAADPTATRKAELRDAVVAGLRAALPAPPADTPGMDTLRRFYGEAR